MVLIGSTDREQSPRLPISASMSREFLLRMLPPASIGAEVGVHRGDFSQRILDIVRPSTLHLVDPWVYRAAPIYSRSHYGGAGGVNQAAMDRRYAAVSDRFAAQQRSRQVVMHRAASVVVADRFPDNHLDWVYIDADHRYEAVRQDLAVWLPKLRPGGILAGDDYGLQGWWSDGVTRAVDEFVAAVNVQILVIADRQFALRV